MSLQGCELFINRKFRNTNHYENTVDINMTELYQEFLEHIEKVVQF